MSEPKVVVWHDSQASKKWIVSVWGASGRIDNETPYSDEFNATIIAKNIGLSLGCPVYKSASGCQDELIYAPA